MASNGRKVARVCEQCKADFQATAVQVSAGYGRYCCMRCFTEAKRARRPVMTCERCRKTFTVRPGIVSNPDNAGGNIGRFCSNKCKGEAFSVPRRPLADRFWEKVDKGDGSGCWIWTGGKNRKGYGKIGMGRRGLDAIASRTSWELANGPIPDGLSVLHNCPGGDNPSCINPSHLFLGTNKDNSDDKVAKGRQAKGERCGRAKLTGPQVIEIRGRFRAGSVTLAALAREYGVSGATISTIVNGKAWKHLS